MRIFLFYCLLWWKVSIKRYTPEIFYSWKMRFILSAHPMNSFTNYFHLLSCISELTLVTTVRPPSEAQSSLCGSQPAPDTRTSRSQPPSEATTSRMSPTANLQSITVSSWQGLNGWSVNRTSRNYIMPGDRTQNACPHCAAHCSNV